MRHLFLITFAILALGLSVFPQTNKPKAKSQYVSKESGFTIAFPKTPTRKAVKFDAAFGKANYISYEAGTPTANYLVGTFDFPTVITDEAELDVRFDQVQKSMTSKPGTRLVDERRIYVGEYLGREYVFEMSGFSLTMRVFAVKQRLFQLTLMTKGAVSKSPAVKKLHERLVEGFFDSFAVTELPEPQKTAVELPDDFGVTVVDGEFRSDFFGLRMTLPKGWKIITDDLPDGAGGDETETMRRRKSGTSDYTESALENTKVLVTAGTRRGADLGLFLVAAERVSFPNFLPMAVTDTFSKQFLDPGEVVFKKSSLVKYGGVDFAWVETGVPAEVTRRRLYVANRGGISFQIAVFYSDEKQLADALAALASMKFDDVSAESK